MGDERRPGSPPRVFLTGAAGFGGSHCLRHLLLKTDWNIVCPLSFSHPRLPERFVWAVDTQSWWDRIKIVKMDLSTPINDTTAKLIGPITFIINYASESEAHDSRSLIRNNVNVVLHLLEFARVVNPEAVLLISTDEVYGPARPGYEHKEWDPIVPNSPYSASKAAQEAIAISYWRTFRVPIVLVNADYLIGENQDPTKSVPSLISSIAQEQEVRIHGDLIGSRSYLHARHLGDAILFLLNRGKFRRFCPVEHVMEPDRWNVTGGKELTHLELAQLIANLLGKPLKYKPVGSGSVLHRYALDGTKIMETGWRAPINFEESLLPMIEWTLGHGSWKKGV